MNEFEKNDNTFNNENINFYENESIKSEIDVNNTSTETNNFNEIDDDVLKKSFYTEVIKPKKKRNHRILKKLIIVSALSISLGLISGFSVGSLIPVIQSYFYNRDLADEQTDIKEINLSQKDLLSVNSIKKVKPSIVSITSSIQAKDFFEKDENNLGSGIIFHKTSSNAYIVTNYHVIQNANSVKVSVEGKEFVPARLINKDQNADLAVIAVSTSDLNSIGIKNVVTADFGDSDTAKVGDEVIAIGNPLGRGSTATSGIISALQKEIVINNRKLNVLQTDAAINDGNDGGALINQYGQVIGINTAKYSQNRIEGIGYSISSNVAKPIIEELMNNTNPPSLGVYISNLPEDVKLEDSFIKSGVIVTEVVPGGSAEKYGIKKMDIITGFNDKPIFTTDQLISEVKNCKAGDVVEVKLVRNAENFLTVKVKLLEANKDTSF